MRRLILMTGLLALMCLSAPALAETYLIEAPQAGEYSVRFEYRALSAGAGDLDVTLTVDGEETPLSLSRLWRDDIAGDFESDENGDQLSPRQIEVSDWTEARLNAIDPCDDSEMVFTLSAGTHEIALLGEIETRNVRLVAANALPTHEEYLAAHADAAPAASGAIVIEAERAALKSMSGLTPFCDRSGPDVTPADAQRLMLNALGGYGWRQRGQWVEWTFDAPDDGLYTLSLHFLQSGKRGLAGVRALSIDGEIPFAEARALSFPYGYAWQTLEFPYAIYLTAGAHTLRLTCCLGEVADTLRGLDAAVTRLGDVYRDIIMVTGATPDLNRDYYLDSEIPGMMDGFSQARAELEDAKNALYALGGESGDASFLQIVIDQLDAFLDDPRCIPKKLTAFRSNITSLADLALSMREQPLTLDSLTLRPLGTQAKKPATLLENLSFRLGSFLHSFSADYAALSSGKGERAIEVWLSASSLSEKGAAIGRDQAQLLERMIASQFTPESGVSVKLSLVNSEAALVQSIVSGTGPDVVMFAGEGTPVILAVRGAAQELSSFPGYAEIASRFHPSALVPFTFEGGVYALPDTQMYYLTYYRTDIFADLNLTVPDTWEDFYSLIKRLHRVNLNAGIGGADQNIFETLLLQRGTGLYNASLSQTVLTEPDAVAAFTEWTQLYTKHGLDVTFDFLSRFRSGEMPIGIMPMALYASLSSAAPEIAGRWAIAPIPGTRREGGTVDRAESCQAAGTVMLADAEDKEACFAFLEWWSRADTQATFGEAVEAAWGASSRYFTANTEAMARLNWSADEMRALLAQREFVTDIPQTPASYYVSRCVTNAFRNVVYHQGNPREAMVRYAAQIDEELARKRAEFGLE